MLLGSAARGDKAAKEEEKGSTVTPTLLMPLLPLPPAAALLPLLPPAAALLPLLLPPPAALQPLLPPLAAAPLLPLLPMAALLPVGAGLRGILLTLLLLLLLGAKVVAAVTLAVLLLLLAAVLGVVAPLAGRGELSGCASRSVNLSCRLKEDGDPFVVSMRTRYVAAAWLKWLMVQRGGDAESDVCCTLVLLAMNTRMST
jgi:hypothetical protein